MTCEEFEELSGAYALGAITPAEREAARTHLAGCSKCTRHLQELRTVVDLLPYSVTQADPPESLKGRILEAVRRENRNTPIEPTPINQPPKRRWSTLHLAVAAVLLLLLFGGMTGWNIALQQQNTSLEHQMTALEQRSNSLESRVTSLEHQVALSYAIQGNPSAQKATGKLIYLPGQNITLLVVEGLPRLQGTQVYQGWLIHGNQPKSIGLLSVENSIASVLYPGNISGYQVAAVSREPGPAASKNGPAGPVVAEGALNILGLNERT